MSSSIKAITNEPNIENVKNDQKKREQQNRSQYQNSYKKNQWQNSKYFQIAYFDEKQGDEKITNESTVNTYYMKREGYDYSPMKKYENEYLTMKNTEIDENSTKMSEKKIYDESIHFAESNSSNSQTIDSSFLKVKITMICRRCNSKFYFNNKFHKHLRICNRETSPKIKKNALTHIIISHISVIESTNKQKNFHGFAFRTHHYATVKKALTSQKMKHDFCMNNDTFMFFINRTFLKRHVSTTIIRQTIPSIKIKKIGFKIHDNFEYVIMNVYIFEKMNDNFFITHIKAKLHLMNELKTNIFVKINVKKSKNMILNFEKKIFIIFICKNMEVLISIQRKNASISRTMRTIAQVTISIKMIMIVSIRIRNVVLFADKDYNFFSKIEKQLNSKKNFLHM